MPPVCTVKPDGPAIRERRLRLGLTLAQLGKSIGRHPQALRHIERETRNASEVLINQIANALGVEPAQIIRPDDTADAA